GEDGIEEAAISTAGAAETGDTTIVTAAAGTGAGTGSPGGASAAAGAGPAGPRLQGRGGPVGGADPGGITGLPAQATGEHGAGHRPHDQAHRQRCAPYGGGGRARPPPPRGHTQR